MEKGRLIFLLANNDGIGLKTVVVGTGGVRRIASPWCRRTQGDEGGVENATLVGEELIKINFIFLLIPQQKDDRPYHDRLTLWVKI